MENINYLINRMITARQEFLNRHLKPLGLTSSLFPFMLEIIQHKKLTQKQLSHLLRVDPALTTRSIRKLLELEYVQKENDPRDRRANYISLSQKGQELSVEILKLNREWFRMVARDVPLPELEKTMNMLKQIVIRLESEILGDSTIPPTPVQLPEDA